MGRELVTKYLPYVDELFTQESKKSILTNNDFSFDGAATVRLYKISTSEMNDYGRNGAKSGNWSRYGAVKDLDATTETATLKKDRSFTFVIDALDQNQTGGTLAGASALARQLWEVVVPEVDTYVYGVMCAGAGQKPAAVALTKDNIYDEIIKASAALDDALVPETGADMRIKGVIGNLDGAMVVKIAASRRV